MVKEVHKVVRESGGHRIIIANSATSIDENNRNDVVVDGSHFGLNVGQMALKAGVLGMIGNDAGLGLEDAGIAGLKFLEKLAIPAAAVSSMSARIGDGTSTYEEGTISAANDVAKKIGIKIGISAKEAADKMFVAALQMMKEGKQRIVKTFGKSRLIIVDTTSDVNEGNSNDIIITGSHSGKNSGEYLSSLNIKGVIGNDGGMGKENAGIAGLQILEECGIPAATVSAMSAKIGNGTSTYERGKISAVNESAKKLGITASMPAKEAADKMFEALIRQLN
jgi:uncharacterized protein YunC (DUF1805 family)